MLQKVCFLRYNCRYNFFYHKDTHQKHNDFKNNKVLFAISKKTKQFKSRKQFFFTSQTNPLATQKAVSRNRIHFTLASMPEVSRSRQWPGGKNQSIVCNSVRSWIIYLDKTLLTKIKKIVSIKLLKNYLNWVN